MTYEQSIELVNQNPDRIFFGKTTTGHFLTLNEHTMRGFLHSGGRFDWMKVW